MNPLGCVNSVRFDQARSLLLGTREALRGDQKLEQEEEEEEVEEEEEEEEEEVVGEEVEEEEEEDEEKEEVEKARVYSRWRRRRFSCITTRGRAPGCLRVGLGALHEARNQTDARNTSHPTQHLSLRTMRLKGHYCVILVRGSCAHSSVSPQFRVGFGAMGSLTRPMICHFGPFGDE
ncbi:hypothetical protein Pcinc_000180 [Petrolisthes cinctipes]|uniref:Uncharacterized protein n=1 Tax=Petrolisthes cinctipes TaxID=88211 RepID=A0AAE1GQ57_PETCI|nr:hypothetical protein Pcinc_000180 [Petrolisthes cinctipes]